MVYTAPQSVVETKHFISRCKAVAMSDEEKDAAIYEIAKTPLAGVLIPGGQGIRKIRAAYGSRGKSGGVRMIYYLGGASIPIFMLDVYGKNDKSDLTQDEISLLGQLAKTLGDTYRGGRHG